MIRGIIIGHGEFAEAMLKTAEQIVGEQPEVEIISNRGMSCDSMITTIDGILQKGDIDRTIVFLDLPGGSCTISCYNLLKDKKDLHIRVRPSYFPFVEPGLEIDASCPLCTTGCSLCKQTGWIEICGAGRVHPNVLRASNIDPEIYSGFAFGFGLTRLALLHYAIDDIRHLHNPKIEFLAQF